MDFFYCNDRTTLILLSLLKAHGIRKIVASPGTTNMCFVASAQSDSWFEMYSSVDERSAAYIACGLANESCEPVVITCTEATASRNYFPGLTEAYYRKLPILVITGYHSYDNIGHLYSQVIDRSRTPIDTVKLSLTLRKSENERDEWINTVNINKAILALTHNGGGPAHLNLQFPEKVTFDVRELPNVRVINRITVDNSFPELPDGKIVINVGSHKPWSKELTEIVDTFCSNHNAAVFCDSTSGYRGKYSINYSLVAIQKKYTSSVISVPDLVIHIGEVSGDTYTQSRLRKAKMTWRVSEDGEVRDFFHNLRNVFQMSEMSFFKHYQNEHPKENLLYHECLQEKCNIQSNLQEYNFSNLWIANFMSDKMPKNSVIHMGIFNTLRSWNMNTLSDSVLSNCNVGGFGIDGAISTALGAALANPCKNYYCICGDLAFYYDMNVLGNRHFPQNLRVMVINNGKGTEFRNYGHPAFPLGEYANSYIAAAGHYEGRNQSVIKGYSESLGFKYITASTKEQFKEAYIDFLDTTRECCPVIFEVFTKTEDETESLKKLCNTENNTESTLSVLVKRVFRNG